MERGSFRQSNRPKYRTNLLRQWSKRAQSLRPQITADPTAISGGSSHDDISVVPEFPCRQVALQSVQCRLSELCRAAGQAPVRTGGYTTRPRIRADVGMGRSLELSQAPADARIAGTSIAPQSLGSRAIAPATAVSSWSWSRGEPVHLPLPA
jgi:hypothetical protein